jgi:hypothetical protein
MKESIAKLIPLISLIGSVIDTDTIKSAKGELESIMNSTQFAPLQELIQEFI